MTEFPDELITAINNHRLAVTDFEDAKNQPGITAEELREFFDTSQGYAGVLAVYEVFFGPEFMTAARREANSGLDQLQNRLKKLGG